MHQLKLHCGARPFTIRLLHQHDDMTVEATLAALMLALRMPPSPSRSSRAPTTACFLFRLAPCTGPAVYVVLVGDLMLRMAKLKNFSTSFGCALVCVCVCLFVCLHVCLYWCAGLSAETWYKENNGFLCKQRTKRISKIKLQLCPESPGSKNANKITLLLFSSSLVVHPKLVHENVGGSRTA